MRLLTDEKVPEKVSWKKNLEIKTLEKSSNFLKALEIKSCVFDSWDFLLEPEKVHENKVSNWLYFRRLFNKRNFCRRTFLVRNIIAFSGNFFHEHFWRFPSVFCNLTFILFFLIDFIFLNFLISPENWNLEPQFEMMWDTL